MSVDLPTGVTLPLVILTPRTQVCTLELRVTHNEEDVYVMFLPLVSIPVKEVINPREGGTYGDMLNGRPHCVDTGSNVWCT